MCKIWKAPQKYSGWQNRTWVARDYKPICPQLRAYTFDEIHNGYAPHAIKTDENCLFLNIWTPQVKFNEFFHKIKKLRRYEVRKRKEKKTPKRNEICIN